MAKNDKNKKKHLRDEERFCIEKMLKAGHMQKEIACVLGRGKSTVSEEVKLNGGNSGYTAEKAIKRAYLKQYRKKRNCNKVALDGHLTKFVEKKLEAGWSPEVISYRLEIQSGLAYASPKSIRKFIRVRSGLERFLFWNRNSMKSGRKRGDNLFLSDPHRKWIDIRPMQALYEYGHWEMDFIVSKHNSSVLLVCVEKYSKLLKLVLLPDRTTEVVEEALTRILKGYVVKTITTDNDIAFRKWTELEILLHTSIYFCHPYHSWEKGLVENSNRWIREFIPKKTDLKSISSESVSDIEDYFNHKPRECLDGKTAYEVSMLKECGGMYGTIVESLSVNFPDIRIWG
jgi:IS30 family transposase